MKKYTTPEKPGAGWDPADNAGRTDGKADVDKDHGVTFEGESQRAHRLETAVISTEFSVAKRLNDLEEWREMWLEKRALIQAQRAKIDVSKPNVGSALTMLEVRWEMLQVQVPMAWSHAAIEASGGYGKVWDHMAAQYAELSREKNCAGWSISISS